jgi:hypothetical protein
MKFGFGKRCAGVGCSNVATDDSAYCEKCAEFKKQVLDEESGMVRCAHCNKLMLPGAFDRHGWSVYYREGYKPNGKRKRKR